jgi:hypothetical protein
MLGTRKYFNSEGKACGVLQATIKEETVYECTYRDHCTCGGQCKAITKQYTRGKAKPSVPWNYQGDRVAGPKEPNKRPGEGQKVYRGVVEEITSSAGPAPTQALAPKKPE